MLVLWALSNGALVATILAGDISATFSEGQTDLRTKIYMVIILSFVACLALFRLIVRVAQRTALTHAGFDGLPRGKCSLG